MRAADLRIHGVRGQLPSMEQTVEPSPAISVVSPTVHCLADGASFGCNCHQVGGPQPDWVLPYGQTSKPTATGAPASARTARDPFAYPDHDNELSPNR